MTEESLAKTTIVIARAALEQRCNSGLEPHLADALAEIAIDPLLPLDVRTEAYRLLEAAAESIP